VEPQEINVASHFFTLAIACNYAALRATYTHATTSMSTSLLSPSCAQSLPPAAHIHQRSHSLLNTHTHTSMTYKHTSTSPPSARCAYIACHKHTHAHTRTHAHTPEHMSTSPPSLSCAQSLSLAALAPCENSTPTALGSRPSAWSNNSLVVRAPVTT